MGRSSASGTLASDAVLAASAAAPSAAGAGAEAVATLAAAPAGLTIGAEAAAAVVLPDVLTQPLAVAATSWRQGPADGPSGGGSASECFR